MATLSYTSLKNAGILFSSASMTASADGGDEFPNDLQTYLGVYGIGSCTPGTTCSIVANGLTTMSYGGNDIPILPINIVFTGGDEDEVYILHVPTVYNNATGSAKVDYEDYTFHKVLVFKNLD